VAKAYAKPPLVEAVFEVFVEDPSPWNDQSQQRLEQELTEKFSGPRDTLQPSAVQIQIGPEQAFSQRVVPEPPRRRMWTPDRGELFQFGPAMCAYNLLSHYRSFEQHAARLEELTGRYLEERKPAKIAWAGQRYVNRILVPVDQGDPASYFEVYPKLPTGQHRPFALQVVSGEFAGGQAVLNLAFQGEESGSAVYMLDIYARSSIQFTPDAVAIRRWQEQAHGVVRSSFEATLTGKTRALFQEGGQP
jgi:uncharacterized protein (TIGR04255 family)